MADRPYRDILIRCPTTGTVVRTGLNTGMVQFCSLAEVPFSGVCSACGKIHRWSQVHAWIDSGTVPAAKGLAEENSRHPLEAQKLSHQLRAAEIRVAELEAEIELCRDKAKDRVGEFEAKVKLYRDKADRAERLLTKVYREIEERLIKQQHENGKPAPSSLLPGAGRTASAKDRFLKAPGRLSHEA